MSIRELENIKPLDEEAMSEAEKRWLSVVKPLFSLGRLEETITQIAGIKGKSDFTLDKKALVIMWKRGNGYGCQKFFWKKKIYRMYNG